MLSGTLLAAGLVAGCAAPTTIRGEIHDDRITFAQPFAPPDAWAELTNRGSLPCELAGALTEVAPDALPVEAGRVVFDLRGEPQSVDRMEAYSEVGGQAVEQPPIVQPGQTVRTQLTMSGTPERAERILLCNGPGDYERGRYAVLRFER